MQSNGPVLEATPRTALDGQEFFSPRTVRPRREPWSVLAGDEEPETVPEFAAAALIGKREEK